MFRYRVRLTAQEARRVYYYDAYRSASSHIRFWLMLILPLLVVAADMLRSELQGGTEINSWLWSAAGGCWGFAWFLGPGVRRIAVRRLMKSPLATQTITFDISQQGLLLKSANMDALAKWDGFLDFEEVDGFFLLRWEEQTWYVLPLRVIPEDERDDLAEFLHDMVPEPD
jgi:hypothetical protein